VTDAKTLRVHSLGFEHVELIQGTLPATLVIGMSEDGQSRAKMNLADCLKHLAFVRVHVKRRADFTKGAPPFGHCIPEKLIDDLCLGFLSDGRGIWCLVITSGNNDVYA